MGVVPIVNENDTISVSVSWLIQLSMDVWMVVDLDLGNRKLNLETTILFQPWLLLSLEEIF